MADDGISTFPESSPGPSSTDAPAPKADTQPSEPKADAPEAKPDAPDDTADPSPATQSEPKEGESVAAPEAAKRPEGRNAETRIKQLIAEKRALERQLQQRSPQPGQVPQAKQPARPKLDQFDDVGQYESALEKYETDLKAYTIDQANRQARAKAQQEQIQQKQAEIAKDWGKREARIKKSNPDFNAVQALERIAPTPAMDSYITESDYGPELVDYLDSNSEEAEELRGMSPVKQLKELVKLEDKLALQVKGIQQPKGKSDVTPPGYVQGKASSPAKPKTAADILYG